MRDLKSEYGLTPASVYRWISEGTFPVPVNIGSNSVAWHRNEIEIWLQSRPRAKVKLHTDRGGQELQLRRFPSDQCRAAFLTWATRTFFTNSGAQPRKRASSFPAGSNSIAHSR